MEKFESKGKGVEARHHASYVPMLSLEERDRRWGLLREYMVEMGIECLVIYGNDVKWGMGLANIRYVTHIGSYIGGYAVLPVVGETVAWEGLPHQHHPGCRYSHTQNWVKDIRPAMGPPPVVAYLKEHNYDRSTIGLVGYFGNVQFGDIIPGSDIDYFQRELPHANIISATGLVNWLRVIKSPEEISFLEKAGEIARKTIDTMIQSAEPGKKECEVFADMVHTQIINGGEAKIFIMLSSGPVADPRNDKSLLHGDHQPTVPTTRPLEKGDLLIVELHANYGAYMVAAEFALYLGKAPDELKRIHEVAVECGERVREAMRAGASFQEVLEAEREPCLRAGMDFVELGWHDMGLGAAEGLTIVEKPGPGILASRGAKLGQLKFRENMIFGTNIDLHDPRWKKDVGIMHGDTLQVMKDGPARCLVNTPKDILEKKL